MEVASPYSQDEAAVLCRFGEICEEIHTCRFVCELPKHDHSITVVNQPDGTSRTQYPQYDKDDFLAFLTHFRKLVANREKTNIFAVLKIIGKHADDIERASLREIKRMLVSEAENPPMQIAIGTLGNETTYTPLQVQNIIFNGQVFHSDSELQGDLSKLLDFEPFTKAVFLRYATIVINNASRISWVLKSRGHISSGPGRCD